MRCVDVSSRFVGRRSLLAWAFASAAMFVTNASYAVEADRAALIKVLRDGGAVLLLRHGQTEPGVGDPPGFKLGDCKTQRNLSGAGIEQTQRTAHAVRAAGINFSKVLTSQWCRCRDTAKVFTGDATDWSALNSFFENARDAAQQTDALKTRLRTVPRRETWLLVTHQVNITALTGISPAMGEGVVVRASARDVTVLGRLSF
jgi:broad specificity phosphatase PhoE